MGTPNEPSFHVLYVEKDSRQALAFMGEFSDLVRITVESDPHDAVALVTGGEPIDLVIYNDQLDTEPFLQAVTQHVYLHDLPIILLTSQLTVDLGLKPQQGHIIDLFARPYAVPALRTRLTYLIRKKQYQEANRQPYKPKSIRMPVGKRLFDIVVSFTALLLLSPLLLVVALLIRLDSRGPIFYRSKRVGTGYRIFDMYKFRTMRTGADKLISSMASQNAYNKPAPELSGDERCDDCRLAGSECQKPLFLDNRQVCELMHRRAQKAKAMFMKFKEDPRVTRLGKFLRNTSIDELPQLFNILRGDMSFVGNRPLPPYEAEKLTTTAYARRFAAPAGLTGLWQVTKRGRAALSDQERIQLDVLYAQKYSFKTDLIILIKTVKAVWQKENV